MTNYTPLYRISLVRDGRVKAELRPILDAPAQVVRLFASVVGQTDREHFLVVLLDARQRVIGVNVASVGTLTASLVHPREVFKSAILANAAGIILAHNHPSGDTQPTPDDLETTRRLCGAGRTLGIPVVDHVIVGDGDAGAWSMQAHGQLGRE